MTEVQTPVTESAVSTAMPPLNKLNHFAWRCRDAEETRHFYEDILGLPLVHTIEADRVPSTGEYAPYFHLFFQMTDGSCIAFFDLSLAPCLGDEVYSFSRSARENNFIWLSIDKLSND